MLTLVGALDSIGDFIAGWDYGTFPDYIAAIGTVAALWVAALAYRRDVAVRKEARRESARAQARRVSIVAGEYTTDQRTFSSAGGHDYEEFATHLQVEVDNQSDDDIHDLHFAVSFELPDQFQDRTQTVVRMRHDFVAQAQTYRQSGPPIRGRRPGGFGQQPISIVGAQLVWHDDEGLYWSTTLDGRVASTTRPPRSLGP